MINKCNIYKLLQVCTKNKRKTHRVVNFSLKHLCSLLQHGWDLSYLTYKTLEVISNLSLMRTFAIHQKSTKTKYVGSAKKKVLFPEIGCVKMFLSLTHPHSQKFVRTYIFCLTNTHTSIKQKKLKKLAGCKFRVLQCCIHVRDWVLNP